MKKTSKVVIIIAAVTAVICVSVAFASVSDKTVTSETFVHQKINYTSCGHHEIRDYPVPSQCVKLTPTNAAKVLNSKLLSYETNILSIESNFNSYCSHHYLVYLEGNKIKVKTINSGKFYAMYHTMPSVYSENDLNLLTNGITAHSDAELSAIIEDFAS